MTDDWGDLDRWRERWHEGMAIAHFAALHPDRMAIVSATGSRTYAELNVRANQLVRALRAGGCDGGVAVMLGNRPEFADVYAATLRTGWRLTTVNWHLTAEEAAYIVRDAAATVFVADAGIDHAVATVAELRDGPDAPRLLSVGGDIEGAEPLEDVLAGQDPSDIDDPTLGTTMLYTSGTTGRPKGVRRDDTPQLDAHPALYGNGAVHLCTGPLYHAAPLALSMYPPLACGGSLVLMGDWDAEETLRLIDEHGVTHVHMVPTMFHRLLALPDDVKGRYDVSSLQLVVHGAAPCPVEVKRRVIEWWGPVVVEYYAATEGAGTLVDSRVWLEHPGTVGKVTPPDHIVIGTDDAEPLPVGEVGTVWLKAPKQGRFRYHGDEEKTSSSYRGDYFTLGDMGYVDDEGYLFLTDRSANLIISGGVNIYPAEVDAVLLEHPAVGDVATIGVPDDEWGESVKAVVQLRDGASPSEELAAELIAFSRDRLAHYKCPRSVDFVDELPRHDTGKIYKRLLRDQYRDAAAGQPGA